MNDHQQYREWSAAYVIGALDSDERREFEVHLATCDECRNEVAAFAPLPGLLHGVDEEEVARAPERIADLAANRVAAERKSVGRSRRRWRWAAGVAAAVAVVALLTPAVGNLGQARGTDLALDSSAGATGAIQVEAKPWGTAIDIELSNLPTSDRYVAWAVSKDGEWEQISAWGPTPNNTAILKGASSIPTEDLASVVITTGDPTDTVVTADAGA